MVEEGATEEDQGADREVAVEVRGAEEVMGSPETSEEAVALVEALEEPIMAPEA